MISAPPWPSRSGLAKADADRMGASRWTAARDGAKRADRKIDVGAECRDASARMDAARATALRSVSGSPRSRKWLASPLRRCISTRTSPSPLSGAASPPAARAGTSRRLSKTCPSAGGESGGGQPHLELEGPRGPRADASEHRHQQVEAAAAGLGVAEGVTGKAVILRLCQWRRLRRCRMMAAPKNPGFALATSSRGSTERSGRRSRIVLRHSI